MAWRPHLSLRQRLTVLSTLAAVAALLIGSTLVYSAVSASLDDALLGAMRGLGADVREVVAQGVAPVQGGALRTQVLDEGGTVLSPAGEVPLLTGTDLEAATRGEVVLLMEREGSDVQVVASPARAADGSRRVVAVSGSTAGVDGVRRRLVGTLLVAGTVTAVVAGIAAWALGGAALRPVRNMTRRARTLAPDDPNARLPVPDGHDEIAELGGTLNQMLDRIGTARMVERSFIDDASHELRAPLAVVRGELELALMEQGGADAEATARALASALEETDRLANLTDHLLLLARADAGMLDGGQRSVSLLAVVAAVSGRLDSRSVVQVAGDDGWARGDPVSVEQMVTNLVDNATRWADTRVSCVVSTEGDRARLRVSDDGPGFDPEMLPHAFDRFRRGDPARQRTGSGGGLGLAITAALARAAGGEVRIGNGSTLGGAWAEVTLPAAPAP